MRHTTLVLGIVVLSVVSPLGADPAPRRDIKHPKSACMVTSTAGGYPLFKVTRGKKTVYSPSSDGIMAAVFSPEGTRIAFVGSEISGVDAPNGEVYSLVVFECKTGKWQGYHVKSFSGTVSWKTESMFIYTDTETGKTFEYKFDAD